MQASLVLVCLLDTLVTPVFAKSFQYFFSCFEDTHTHKKNPQSVVGASQQLPL